MFVHLPDILAQLRAMAFPVLHEFLVSVGSVGARQRVVLDIQQMWLALSRSFDNEPWLMFIYDAIEAEILSGSRFLGIHHQSCPGDETLLDIGFSFDYSATCPPVPCALAIAKMRERWRNGVPRGSCDKPHIHPSILVAGCQQRNPLLPGSCYVERVRSVIVKAVSIKIIETRTGL